MGLCTRSLNLPATGAKADGRNSRSSVYPQRRSTASATGCALCSPNEAAKPASKSASQMAKGHIRARGPGAWELKYDIGVNPVTGRRITKYKTVHGAKRDAQRELRTILDCDG